MAVNIQDASGQWWSIGVDTLGRITSTAIAPPSTPSSTASPTGNAASYEQIWRQVLGRCPIAGTFLAQQWVAFAFRDLLEKRRWSWLMKRGQFVINKVINTGTVTVTRNSPTVTGSGTAWTGVEAGRQFRVGLNSPIYDIASVAGQVLTLNDNWGGATASGLTYQILNCYVTVPVDFHSFVSLYDPQMNWQLWVNKYTQEDLNAWDAQRASQGTAYVVAPFDYDSLMLNYPAGTPSLPRYEIWPNQTADYVYPFLYESRIDLPIAGLPVYIPSNVILEGALEQAALWPGPSEKLVNPYFNLQLAQYHGQRFKKMVDTMEVQDDEIYEQSVQYPSMSWGYCPLPFGDARFAQSHAL